MRRPSLLLACPVAALAVAWFVSASSISTTAPAAAAAESGARRAAGVSLGDLRFMPNLGQWNDEVRYAVVGGVSAWAHDDGFTVRLACTPGHRDGADLAARGLPELSGGVVRTRFPGSAREIVPGARLPGATNFLVGADESRWRREVPGYDAVTLRDVQPGIDVALHRRADAAAALEYDLVLAPGADLGGFRARCEGAQSLAVDADGRLRVRVPVPDGIVELVQDRPVAWQETPSGRRSLDVAFCVLGVDSYGFVAAGLDAALPAVVDPGIAWSTYLGGGASDSINDLVWRPGQGIWLGGWAASTDFPTTVGAYHSAGQTDAFVAKLDETGTALQFSTYFGGATFDEVRGIALGPNATVTLVGITDSTNLPVTAGALQATMHGGSPLFPLGDAFVAQLSANGSTLQACTYLGGQWDDVAEAVAIDAQGYTYVGGWTSSFDFPTTAGAWRTTPGGPPTLQTDGFVARIAPGLQSAAWSTYAGGTLNDQFYDLALDVATGQVVVAGWSWSPNFPVTSLAYRTTNSGDMDAVVVRLAANGASALYSTYIGGVDEDLAHAVALATDGSAWIAGWTRSANYPLSLNAPQAVAGGDRDAVISRLSAAGDQLLFSTRLGGPAGDQGRGISVQGTDVMVVGEAGDGFPVTQDALQSAFAQGSLDGFMALLTNGGATLSYSSYAGGSGLDVLDQVVLGSNGLAVMAGWSFASDFPVTGGALQTQRRGTEDGVVLMLDLLTDLGGGLTVGSSGGGAYHQVGAGVHELLGASLHNATSRDVTVDAVRVLVAGQGAGPTQVHDLEVWLDDPAIPGERDVLLGGPVALAGVDVETAIALQGLTVATGGDATVRVVARLDAATTAGSVEVAAAIPGPDAWTLRAPGAGNGPTVRVLGDGRAVGNALYTGALPGDADGDGQFTVLDLRSICHRRGDADARIDLDGDGVLSAADTTLLREAVLGRPSVIGVPAVLGRGTWRALTGVFPAPDSVDVSLGGHSLPIGCLTPRELTVFVPADQAVGQQALTVTIGGRAVASRTVSVQ